MIFVLPYPDRRLLPNQRSQNRKGHWAAQAEAVKESRHTAKLLALDWKNQQPRPFNALTFCLLLITWYPKNNCVADYESMYMACKPFVDGLVDAGIMVNDSPRVIKRVELAYGQVDASNPRTEISVHGSVLGQ